MKFLFAAQHDSSLAEGLRYCQRGEIIEVRKAEIDTAGSGVRFDDTKEGQSVRPMGLPIAEFCDERDASGDSLYVFPGERNPNGPFGSFPKHWEKNLRRNRIG